MSSPKENAGVKRKRENGENSSKESGSKKARHVDHDRQDASTRHGGSFTVKGHSNGAQKLSAAGLDRKKKDKRNKRSVEDGTADKAGHATSTKGTMPDGHANGLVNLEQISKAPESHQIPEVEGKTRKEGKSKKKKHQKTQALSQNDTSSMQANSGDLLRNGNEEGERDAPESSKPSRERSKTLKGFQSTSAMRSSWTLTRPRAGRFLSSPALLTSDERHIIVATGESINVYSAADSTLVRPLEVPSAPVLEIALSPSDPNLLYAIVFNRILIYDWTKSKIKGTIVPKRINQLAVSRYAAAPGRDLLLSTTKSGSSLVAFVVDTRRAETIHPQSKLFKSRRPITGVKALEGGRVVVFTTELGFVVGRSRDSKKQERLKFDWSAVRCKETPISFDIRASTRLNGPPSVDIVLGGVQGCIYVYRDVLSHFGDPRDFKPQMLHWHRERVDAVAWSRDGNYIISGGRETVLVQWQLDTGKKQFLPSLESPIESLTVSQAGGSYMIRLADNSNMILSTSELIPTANIASLQSLSASDSLATKPEVPTMDIWSNLTNKHPSNEVSACLRNFGCNELIVAVSSHQSESNYVVSVPTAPYVQRYDLVRERHLQRQALTRTNATNTTAAPDGTKIREPNVTHVRLSSDENWMATVDEWTPPLQDLKGFSTQAETDATMASRYSEVVLQFWRWQAHSQQWELNSRILNPHQLSSGHDSGRILALATHPLDNAFATFGEDSTLRLWSCKTRLANGRIARGVPSPSSSKQKRPVETWWSAHASIALPSASTKEPIRNLLASHASLAYSNDGSCVAVNRFFAADTAAQNAQVFFVDTGTAKLRAAHENALSSWPADHGRVNALAFLERHLIVLGASVAQVWDVTSFSPVGAVRLPEQADDALADVNAAKSRRKRGAAAGGTFVNPKVPPPKLAVNVASGTFAIATPIPAVDGADLFGAAALNPMRTHVSHVAVYGVTGRGEQQPAGDERKVEMLFEQKKTTRLCMSLLSASGDGLRQRAGMPGVGRKGYLLIDSGASVRWLEPSSFGGGGSSDRAGTELMATQEDGEEHGDDDGRDTDAGEEGVVVDTGFDGESGAAAAAASEGDEEDRGGGQAARSELELEFEFDAAGKAVVRPERLAALFEGPGNAMPPVAEMWQGVVALYAPKGRGNL